MDASFDAQRDAGPDPDADAQPPNAPAFEILAPQSQRLPLVLASPHSGNAYSADFLASSRLNARALRKSEDCFVDEIFAFAPGFGVPLIRALFPRAYLDVNREAYELFRRLWREDKVTWSGRYRPSLTDAETWPRPLQRPVRVWHGSATSRESVDLAARWEAAFPWPRTAPGYEEFA